jgi:multidrug efflux pump subunit AcrA (membrane-fusion protein)
MQQLVLNISGKRWIGKLGIALMISIVLLTFLSKTIHNSLMPRVKTAQFVKGSLEESFDEDGTIEYLGKHKVFAAGSWRVKEVAVTANQQVEKGDVLAVFNEEDIQITLKTIEYELLKLENDLQRYKDGFKPIRLPDYERELKLAQRELEEAENNLKLVGELFAAGLESGKNLDAARDNYDDRQYLYQLKEETLQNKKKESVAQQDEFDRTVREKTMELELKKLKCRKQSYSLTEDFKMLCDMDGIVTAVHIEPGIDTQLNQVMFEIIDTFCPARAIWYLSEEKAPSFAVGNAVSISITGEIIGENADGIAHMDNKSINTEVIKTKITGKEYITTLGMWKYWADIDRDENGTKLSIKEGQKTRVRAVYNGQAYDYLLPKSSIAQVCGKYCIYEVKQRPGALGTENYVKETEVEILSENDFYVALSGFFNNVDKVVVNTTKPLSEGKQVRVR